MKVDKLSGAYLVLRFKLNLPLRINRYVKVVYIKT